MIEIGGGAGWQAQAFAATGYSVRSFDLPNSQFSDKRVFPIEDYDGRHIPVADASFDLAFSSNVLEHIADAERFQVELRRVLKPGGIALHILPSATWRLYTSLAHYPWLAKTAIQMVRDRGRPNPSEDAAIVSRAAQKLSKSALLQRVVLSPKHGEKGNALSEIWHFSRFSWTPFFQKAGWLVLSRYPNRLFYTGYCLFDDNLSLETRRRLSYVLGSACQVYVLRRHP